MFEVHFGRRHHIGVILWIGVVFLVLAALLYAKVVADEHARNLEPLVLPVSLRVGTIRTPELGTDLNGDYDIFIDFQKRAFETKFLEKESFDKESAEEKALDIEFDFHRMECLLGDFGANGVRPDWCDGIPDLVDISWSLLEGEKVVSEGNSRDYPGAMWSATVERQIGRFVAVRGHKYRLVLNVKRDASELNIANPKLMVVIPLDESEGYGVQIEVEQLGALVLALMGATIVLGQLFFLELRRRKPM